MKENVKVLQDAINFAVAEWKLRAEKAEADLAALKKDARICAIHVVTEGTRTIEEHDAAAKILEATKEEIK